MEPVNATEWRARARFLSAHHIRPIWYPHGRHDLIAHLLAYLVENIPSDPRSAALGTESPHPNSSDHMVGNVDVPAQSALIIRDENLEDTKSQHLAGNDVSGVSETPQVRVFVSHHHSPEEDAFTVRLVADLRTAGADVWVDTSGIQSGSFVAKISEGLAGRQWVVLVMTPEALASPWVRTEVEAGLNEFHAGRMLGVIPFVMRQCRTQDIPVLWRTLQRYYAPKGYELARDQLLAALGLSAVPAEQPQAQPDVPVAPPYAAPPDRFPLRLAELGYKATFLNGAEVIRPPLCDVSAGPFLMGTDPTKDGDGRDDEQPQNWVTLGAFQIGMYPVTVAEYACFVRATGQAAPTSSDGWQQLSWETQLQQRLDHPVVNVSWRDALAYARWLAEHTSQHWRMPTEAEWEKTARWEQSDGSARLYPWGDTFDASRANTEEGKNEMTTPVGSYPSGASPYGAQDMAGNVWEWTTSLYKPYPYTATYGRERAESTENRTLRGGAWNRLGFSAGTARRYGEVANLKDDDVGFRLVVSPIS
jgi:formylglycine-generating enzyme required for sulfatase activity